MKLAESSEVVTMPMTSVNVDAELLRLAKEALGVRTNREAINLALEEIAHKKRLLDGIKRMAEMDFEPDAVKIDYPLPSPVTHVDD
jgi:hypothetical protein